MVSIISFAYAPVLSFSIIKSLPVGYRARGGVVVKALCYKPVGRGFDSRWSHWNFSVT